MLSLSDHQTMAFKGLRTILKATFIEMGVYSHFKKGCGKKSIKSSSQDRKVMWIVSNSSFDGKQSLD